MVLQRDIEQSASFLQKFPINGTKGFLGQKKAIFQIFSFTVQLFVGKPDTNFGLVKIMGKKEKQSTHRLGTVSFERRKHPRFSIDLPVEYWQINDSTSQAARTADISEGGLLLHVYDKLELGQKLKVKLFFYTGLQLQTIESHVEVVWKDIPLDKEGYHRIGVKFIDISLADMEELRSLLHNLMDSKIIKEFKIPSRLLSTLGISIVGNYAYLTPESSNQDSLAWRKQP